MLAGRAGAPKVGGVRDRGARPVVVRRIYHQPADDGRTRVLVDGLWPRGLGKQADAFDEWMKAVAPSAGLRSWYRHEPDRYDDFRRRYREELAEPGRRDALDRLGEYARTTGVALLIATRAGRRRIGRRLASLGATGVVTGSAPGADRPSGRWPLIRDISTAKYVPPEDP